MIVGANKKIVFFFVVVVSIIVACSTNNDFDFRSGSPLENTGAPTSPTEINSDSELFNFDIAINDSFFTEQETIDSNDEDYVENTTFTQTIDILFSSNTVSYTTLPQGVSASVEGAKITIDSSTSENIIFRLSGTSTDGMFKLYSDKKCELVIDNLTLTNTDGPAINLQTKKRIFIVLSDNSNNSLADGTYYVDTGEEDAKGVIFSEGQLVFSGGGKLTISAAHNAAISSDQYLRFRPGNVINVEADKGNAVRGKDSIRISGGVINITIGGQGNKGFKTDGTMTITGGRSTVVNTAAAYYDSSEGETKGPAGINCDGDFSMEAGELYLKSTGTGGKGITTDGKATIAGGTVRVITTGKKFTYGASTSGGGPTGHSGISSQYNKSPKGIRSEGTLTISGGNIMSRTTGGEGSEAIESKSTLTIAGGTLEAYAYDDAINSSAAMYLSAGDIFAVSSNNDGLDSNGNMYISGGNIITFGLGEDGVDVIERGTLNITGGTLFSLGNTHMTSPSSSSSQLSISRQISGLNAGTIIKLTIDNSSSPLFEYTMPFTISRAYMILSLSSLAKGNSYVLSVGNSSETISL